MGIRKPAQFSPAMMVYAINDPGGNMIRSMNIAWWTKRWAELHPNKTAIIFEEDTLSYAELHQRLNKTACWMQSLGIEKGDRVAVMTDNCPEFIYVYLACSALGAIFVPLNFRITAPELEYYLSNSDPRLFVFGSEYESVVADVVAKPEKQTLHLAALGATPGLELALNFHEAIAGSSNQPPVLTRHSGPADPEEPQVIMYTYGTTSGLRGAVLSHRKTFFNCLNADLFFQLDVDDRMLIVLPLHHSSGLFYQAAPTIYKGATMILHPRFDADKVYADIERYRVTKFLGGPTVYKAMLVVPPTDRSDLSSLQICAGGGEHTPLELLAQCRKAGLAMCQIMGRAETSVLLWASEEDAFRKPGTVGRPVFHADVRIVDSQGQPVEPGVIGEIVVQGSIMMKAYWRDPVTTNKVIKNGWLHTGDLARMDEDGYFYLVGRATDMFFSGGERIYPAEIERVLREHPDIEDVAVKGMTDRRWGEVGHAFVIVKNNAILSAEGVVNWCEGRLVRYKRPRKVTFCDTFPLNPDGKVDKGVL